MTALRFALLRLAPLALALKAGTAGAACQIERLELGVAPYNAVQAERGSLRVGVRCEAPTDTYRLALDGVRARPDFGAKQLSVQLTGPGASLDAQIQNALPALGGAQGGLLFRGDQTLDFVIFVPQDQWQAGGGQYSARLGLNLLPAAPGE